MKQQLAIGVAAASLLLGTPQVSAAERYGMCAPPSIVSGEAVDNPYATRSRSRDNVESVLGGTRPCVSDEPYPGYAGQNQAKPYPGYRLPRIVQALPAQLTPGVILRGYPSSPPSLPLGNARATIPQSR
jgi:hypothetical protein